MKKLANIFNLTWGLAFLALAADYAHAATISLDGKWLLAPDPKNEGRENHWWIAPPNTAKTSPVPWIIEDTFSGYHGIAWYWKDFVAPVNPSSDGRMLLRFWQVDYKAEVWLDNIQVGSHEGGESPFTLDVSGVIKPGQKNRLAVRVLNPTHQPIDGIVLNQVPHSNRVLPYGPGNSWDVGGILGSVELLVAPVIRVEDLYVCPDWKTGQMHVKLNLRNAGARTIRGQIQVAVAPSATGETLVMTNFSRELKTGDTLIESSIRIEQAHLWNLDDPFLYRVSARVSSATASVGNAPENVHEQSVRCGFRDFRFENGAFRLNGKRIYLRCSHTGNNCPVGLVMPPDPDYLRRDIVNQKMMGFNAIRFIAGVPKRYQLDLADEIGLMIYPEADAAWCLEDSPHMTERYDESTLGMIRRDRNHPCIIMWGLLNETHYGPIFSHAVSLLPKVRKLDDSRVVLLNSGRFDGATDGAPVEIWRNGGFTDPCITHNGSDHVIKWSGITWQPGQLAFHPGGAGEYAVVRWTAPAAGTYEYSAAFSNIAEAATTDLHVLHNSSPLFDSVINLDGKGPSARFSGRITVMAGDTLDSVCGWGNHDNGSDSTALAVTIKSSTGETWDAARDFSLKLNPNGVWIYGMMKPAAKPDSRTFDVFPTAIPGTAIGSISNPGSKNWEDVLDDAHPYQHVPHTADNIHALRTLGSNGKPVWLSEYGVGSPVDLLRVVKRYEQAGKSEAEDAQLYRSWRDQYLADWQRYRLADVFGGPEDFFTQAIARMASQRLVGLNAIRSNPNVVGYSLTGTVDQGMTGEGVWTTFRELKPGVTDALFDGWAPLRWCLFAEPLNIYRGATVKLEAVLANEDVLAPGSYIARLQVIGPNLTRAFDKRITVNIPDRKTQPERPLAQSVFSEDVIIDGPPGDWRFAATFEKGAAACGGETKFFVDSKFEEMPQVGEEIVLMSSDAGLAEWLTAHGIKHRPYVLGMRRDREVILAVGKPTADPAATFRDLAQRIARGSTVVFLTPDTYARGSETAGWLPLKNKGSVRRMARWLYHGDDWAKKHSIFEGLQAGGLMDYSYYRDLIPDDTLADMDPSVEPVAGAIDASFGYQSGLTVAVGKLGAGEFILNTLLIAENLGKVPQAERLLRNMLRFAARNLNQRPVSLPGNFDQQLNAFGY